jgi:hypothetical protein
MTSLEKRLQHLEMRLNIADSPTLAEILREAFAKAKERQRLGLPRPLPTGEDELSQRLRQARLRAQQADARLQDGEPGPWP